MEQDILICADLGGDGTITAFAQAIQAGADVLKADVRMNGDGEVVLAAGDALWELLALALEHPQVKLLIELRDLPAAGKASLAYQSCVKTAETIVKFGMQDRTWISSRDGRLLEHLYRLWGRELRYHGFYPWFLLGELRIRPETYISLVSMEHCIRTPDQRVVRCGDPLCPREWYEQLHSQGIATMETPDPKNLALSRIAFSMGSRMVCCADPAAMARWLEGLGLRSK